MVIRARVPPESRAEWQNFINSEDIRPLGSAYGYQMELPLDRRGRIDRFFDDPRNLRGLLGEITTDLSRNPRAAALRTKQSLQQNPQFLQDVDIFMSRMPFTTAAGIQDAYAMRQLFGESPTEYGSPNPNASTEPRGVFLPSTGERVRVTPTGSLATPRVVTTELSPAERTTATSASLRPQTLAADLELLGDPDLMERAGVEPGSNLDRARALLSRTLNENIDTAYRPSNLALEANVNADDERVRRLIDRNQQGQLMVAGEFPGETVSRLQDLLRQRDADPDYILDYLETNRELPEEASARVDDFDEDINEDLDLNYDEYVDRRVMMRRASPETLNKLISKYPELEKIKSGPTARGTRLPKEQLFELYKDYIPENYKKLPPSERQALRTNMFAGDNPQAREIFYRTIEGAFATDAQTKLEEGRRQAESIENVDERTRVTSYLDDYINNISSTLKPVSPRLAGVGGGGYLTSSVIEELYPRAAEKLELLGDTPYVPEDFQPTLRDTFYSDSGRPYRVKVSRIPSDISKSNLSSNFLNMIENKPFAGSYDIEFTVNDEYKMDDPTIPTEVRNQIKDYIKQNALRGLPAGALVRNSPASDEVFRTNRPGNKRAGAYQQSGFGGQTRQGQFAYIDSDTGMTVPVQPFQQKTLLGEDFMRAYYATDPVSAAARGLGEVGKAIKRTPASLAPGIADLIPSPEAIQTGYAQGPVAMGMQMGQEFVQSLPTAIGASAALAAVPPLAPGIGAGMIGTAGARALNEVVRQETGEGVVPKLRQFMGTTPRTRAASRSRVGDQPLTATIRPSTPQQQAELRRQQTRSELERRIDLVKERFNPRRGEFGLSELLFGR